jgi:hypothetical protein
MYKVVLIAVVIVIILLLVTREGAQFSYAMQQRHPTPDCFTYFGREETGLFGYNQEDNFLENQLQYEQGLGPQLQGWEQYERRGKAYL